MLHKGDHFIIVNTRTKSQFGACEFRYDLIPVTI